MKPVTGAERVQVWITQGPDHDDTSLISGVEIWGLSPQERLCRTLRAAGIPDGQIVVGTTPPVESKNTLLVFRSDYVFDERLVQALIEKSIESSQAQSIALIDPGTSETTAPIVAVITLGSQIDAIAALFLAETSLSVEQRKHMTCLAPSELVSAYSSALRKHDPPYLLPVRPESRTQIENHIFRASYKGITDVITKWVWPLPARAVTRLLARSHVSPNMVTGLSWFVSRDCDLVLHPRTVWPLD